MKYTSLRTLAVLAIAISCMSDVAVSQSSVLSIAQARSKPIGDTVVVRGIVTSAPLRPVYLQDSSAGIAANSPLTDGLLPGDSIEISGVNKNYNNLLELDPVLSVTILSRGLPDPATPVTPITSIGEAFEARLIKIESVHFSQAGVFSGSTNYAVSDGISTLQVRISSGSPLVGTTIPTGRIDIVGVLSQFFSTYQLLPRDVGDLQSLPGPRIGTVPVVDSVMSTGFVVVWTTEDPGTTKLVFGPGESLLDTLYSPLLTKSHSVRVEGLSPGRIFAFQAISANSSGTSEGKVQYVVTPSPGSTGEIQLYFNYTVDETLDLGVDAVGEVNLGAKILERINAATTSIDLALYSFSDASNSAPDIAIDVAEALVTAQISRGVKVRVVFDDRASTVALNYLISNGIPVIKRNITSGLMHNKFWIFDGRDTANATDDWVVTGSWNMTDVGTYNDAQNALFIQDQSLAAIYTKEFEEMFGSSTETPGTSAARFGGDKTDNTPHVTTVGGSKVEVFFSPTDGTSAAIMRSIATAQSNVFFGLLTFTHDDIAATLIGRKNEGVVIRGIINNVNDNGSEYAALLGSGIDVLTAGHQVVAGQFHHKYAIIDPFNPESDPIVITGSHNWSGAAETTNDENTLIIHNSSLARQFVREFANRYVESGGAGSIVRVERDNAGIPDRVVLSEAFPNPFNPSTSVRFSLPDRMPVQLSVFDLLGRGVQSLASGEYDWGTYRVRWEPNAAAGVYVVVLRTPVMVYSRRVILLK